jgi:hypothetical protein
MRFLIISTLFIFSFLSDCHGQSKKSMTPDVYSEWNRIRNVQLSDNGDWAMYEVNKEVGDKKLKIYDTRNDKTFTFNRVKNATFDNNGVYAYFMLTHSFEGLRNLERSKTKKEEMPKDTLCIYNLKNKILTKIPNVKSYSTPEEWGGYIAFLLEPDEVHDTIATPIKESKEAGSKLVLKNIDNSKSDTLYYAKDFVFAKKGKGFVATSKGAEGVLSGGVYNYNFELLGFDPVLETKGDVYNLSWSEKANQLVFIVDNDTTENRIKPYELFYWNKKENLALNIANQKSTFLSPGYNISNYSKPVFSKDGSRIVFKITPPPILQDTTLLDDEIVNVEVWHYNESKLYTQQEISLKNDKKKDFTCVYNIEEKSISVLGNKDYSRLLFDEHYNSKYAIAQHTLTYDKERMWLGHGYFDGFRIDVSTGAKSKFISKSRGRMMRSPNGKYCLWYNDSTGSHWTYNVAEGKKNQVTSKDISAFGDERNDRPMDPFAYGFHGFSDNDQFVIIYDRYDIWIIDPNNKISPKKITAGREDKKVHRIIDLDIEKKTTDLLSPILIHVFDEKDKSESYVSLDITSGEHTVLYKGDAKLDRSPIKAKNSNDCITTIESYSLFPNLVFTDTSFDQLKTFSDVNPQQKEYYWGDIKLHSWVSETGIELDGLLVLPENFDPKKKYPLLVNFYERSSDGLNRHRAPYAHRSTINYSYYSSKGYIIFNPDVVYRIGYPGQSCYESVIPGILSLVEKGFIDEHRIGVQGHSWGGYQIADLLTKTEIFKCAEAGAPVVNMVSAYGGIRWGSGMSRMFQYEKTQSRLGATLWERPDLYLENSPIFKLDKVTTPVLILHNDGDGAVPWYQGIEYFNALRRLNKPSWFLNYNDEPHWPVKWQNRKDFNIRMEQFFDHFLMDDPMPRWMQNGVPAIQKGIDQGLDHKD